MTPSHVWLWIIGAVLILFIIAVGILFVGVLTDMLIGAFLFDDDRSNPNHEAW